MVNNNSGGSASVKHDTNTSSTGSGGAVDEKTMPKDARVMISILKDMGIMDFEPRVVNQLLEFSYRYISTILEDSKVLSAHARKKAVDLDDVKLAVQMHTDHNLTNPPPRDLLLEVAAKRNALSLPVPKQSGGLRLPPDRYCLTATNYRLKPSKKRGPGIAKSHAFSGNQGGYGANYSINSMNSIPQAMKTQVNSSGKLPLNTASLGGATPTFTVKQLSNNKVGATASGNSSNTISSPAAFIKINHPSSTSSTGVAASGLIQTTGTSSTQLNTAAKIQIQPGNATTAGGTGPIFSMTVNPPLLNSTATGGIKRKAEQMENHN